MVLRLREAPHRKENRMEAIKQTLMDDFGLTEQEAQAIVNEFED
jgi:hypothetical protein